MSNPTWPQLLQTADLRDGSLKSKQTTEHFDVIVIGTGAGGGIVAEELSLQGHKVAMVEAGPLKFAEHFKMLESQAYPELYQATASRYTQDRAIKILQGRCVGGGTTVNWSTCLRAPEATLNQWQQRFDLKQMGAHDLAAYYQKAEARVHASDWDVPVNENNQTLLLGLKALKLPFGFVRRNVKDCYNLGYCGLGCPTNAKQSMLITSIPIALKCGATLFYSTTAKKFEMKSDRIEALLLTTAKGESLRLSARHYVLAAGAVGSPALLLRSQAPDPYQQLGKRTFVHPTTVSGAIMPQAVAAYQGAPQVVYSDAFLQHEHLHEYPGFKLEVPPIYPLMMASILPFVGTKHAQIMRRYPRFQACIALIQDGMQAQSQGGQVQLRSDGQPELVYPINDYLWRGFKQASLAMAELQFAAGAKWVAPVHSQAKLYKNWTEAKKAISDLDWAPLKASLVSAHVMGGCAMGAKAQTSVVDSDARHHQLQNLTVIDGSLFPTSLGANPMLTILALAYRQVERIKLDR